MLDLQEEGKEGTFQVTPLQTHQRSETCSNKTEQYRYVTYSWPCGLYSIFQLLNVKVEVKLLACGWLVAAQKLITLMDGN